MGNTLQFALLATYCNGPVNVIEDIIYKLLSGFGEAVRHIWMVYRVWEFKSAILATN